MCPDTKKRARGPSIFPGGASGLDPHAPLLKGIYASPGESATPDMRACCVIGPDSVNEVRQIGRQPGDSRESYACHPLDFGDFGQGLTMRAQRRSASMTRTSSALIPGSDRA